MSNYRKKFIHYLNKNNIEYSETNNLNVKITCIGKNIDKIPIYLLFEENSEGYITLYCWDIAIFKEHQLSDGYTICNKLNQDLSPVKFYLDDENEMIAQITAVLDYDTVGKTCLTLLKHFADAVDEAYPFVLKGLLQQPN